jgi:hypothetical protein
MVGRERSYLRRRRTAVVLSEETSPRARGEDIPRTRDAPDDCRGICAGTAAQRGRRSGSAKPLGLVAPVGEEPKDVLAVLLVPRGEGELDLRPRNRKIHPLAVMLD